MAPRFRTLVFLAAISCPVLTACGAQYSAQAFEAWVVDAETGRPLEGVVAVANWQLNGGPWEGGMPLEQLMVMETVTGPDGRIYFPAWGPIRSKHQGRVRSERPGLAFFKRGYEFFVGSNYSYSVLNPDPGINMRSDYDARTIKMAKFKGDLEEYARSLYHLKSALSFVESDCEWKRAPRMILALDAQQREFNAVRLDWSVYSIDILEISTPWRRDNCGSPREYFGKFQQ
jgi:hypothetical protein